MVLIFDGDYFFNRSLYSSNIKIKRNEKMLDGYLDRQKYMQRLLFDFAYAINLFKPLITDVIFVSDSGSWRKDEMKFDNSVNYKGNRSDKKQKINWDGFNEIKDALKYFLNENGVSFFSVQKAEGDDLICLLVNHFINSNTDCLFYSGDSDLKQLISFDSENENKTMMFCPVSKNLYVSNSFNFWYNESESIDDYLFSGKKKKSMAFNAIFDGILNDKINLVPENPFYCLFSKIVMGDKSDDIPNVCRGVGKVKTQNIFNSVNSHYDLSEDTSDMLNFEFWDYVSSVISNKFTKQCTKDVILERLKRNLKLVTLNEKIIPEKIKNALNKDLEHYKSQLKSIDILSDFDRLKNDCDYIENKSNSITISYFNPLKNKNV